MLEGYYEVEELKKMGIAKFGEDVLISRKASLYMTDKMEFGNHVRIDDFCHLSGKIIIGNNVHIAPYVNLVGGNAGIIIDDFCGISAKGSVYAITDDYSGKALTNPTIPDKYKAVEQETVILNKHALIGVGSVILPGVIVGEGTSVGAMSLVNRSLDSWGMYVGIPCKKISDRKKDLLKFEEEYKREYLM